MIHGDLLPNDTADPCHSVFLSHLQASTLQELQDDTGHSTPSPRATRSQHWRHQVPPLLRTPEIPQVLQALRDGLRRTLVQRRFNWKKGSFCFVVKEVART